MPRPPVFVTGCPRSGTSAFCHWLAACGLAGAEDDRSNPAYPAGFHEYLPLLMFHKALERLDHSEYAITKEPFIREEYLRIPFVNTVFSLAFSPVLTREVDFMKMPQLALSIDFLLKKFPDAHVVALWRNPTRTFRSLVQREFPSDMRPGSFVRSVLLWNVYAHHIIRAAESHPDRVSVVNIDRLMTEPSLSLELLKRLDVNPTGRPTAPEVIDSTRLNTHVGLAWRASYLGASVFAWLLARGSETSGLRRTRPLVRQLIPLDPA